MKILELIHKTRPAKSKNRLIRKRQENSAYALLLCKIQLMAPLISEI